MPGRLDLGAHVGEHELHALKLPDRLAELLAVFDIGHSRVECALRDAQRLRPDRRPRVVEGAQRGLEAGTRLADDPVGRDRAVLEVDLARR